MNKNINNGYNIHTYACPNCYLCGSGGEDLYTNLEDRLFGVGGRWNLKKCRNSECGLLWLDPMPKNEDIDKLYANYYPHHIVKIESFSYRLFQRAKNGYLRAKHPAMQTKIYDLFLGFLLYLHPSRRFDVDIVVTQLPAPGRRLLDIGCGAGKALLRFRELGWDAEGIDIDHEAVKTARAKGLNVQLGQISEQKYPEKCFDVVIMDHVIEHVLEPVRLLQECHRVLKNGGYLIAYSPNVRALGHWLYKSKWPGLDPPRHLYLYSKDTLLFVVKKACFTQAYCHIIPSAHRTWKVLNMIHRRTKSRTIEQIWTGKLLPEMADYLEWLIQRFDEQTGEEILLIAMKS
jgi:2-polyprenyl-3-methyl-5-hydroxy-6-metoxy-1,4-benzoquinol methylase